MESDRSHGFIFYISSGRGSLPRQTRLLFGEQKRSTHTIIIQSTEKTVPHPYTILPTIFNIHIPFAVYTKPKKCICRHTRKEYKKESKKKKLHMLNRIMKQLTIKDFIQKTMKREVYIGYDVDKKK